jgi:hypothetical protein
LALLRRSSAAFQFEFLGTRHRGALETLAFRRYEEELLRGLALDVPVSFMEELVVARANEDHVLWVGPPSL